MYFGHMSSSVLYVVDTHFKSLTEALLMSSTTYTFMEKSEKYQYFPFEKKKAPYLELG